MTYVYIYEKWFKWNDFEILHLFQGYLNLCLCIWKNSGDIRSCINASQTIISRIETSINVSMSINYHFLTNINETPTDQFGLWENWQIRARLVFHKKFLYKRKLYYLSTPVSEMNKYSRIASLNKLSRKGNDNIFIWIKS